MSNQLSQKTYVDDKIRSLNKIVPMLKDVQQEAGNLVETIKNISEASNKISGEIKSLDAARVCLQIKITLLITFSYFYTVKN